MPEARLAPALLRAQLRPARACTSASSAHVVVLPFVAETTTQPRGRRAGEAPRRVRGERGQHAARAASCRRRGRVARDANAVARAAASASLITAAVPSTRAVYEARGRQTLVRGCERVYSPAVAPRPTRSVCGRGRDEVVEGSRYSQIAGIDPERLDAFRAGIRKRYSDEQILVGAARERRAPRPLAHDARVRGRPARRPCTRRP